MQRDTQQQVSIRNRKERFSESQKMEGTRKYGSFNQLIRAPMGSQRLKRQARGLHGSASGSLHICYCCQLAGFVGCPSVGAGVSLSRCCLLLRLLLLCCPVLIQGLSSCLIASRFVVLVIVYCRYTIFYRETEVGWIWDRRDGKRSWEGWMEGKLWLDCIVWEKNLLWIKI